MKNWLKNTAQKYIELYSRPNKRSYRRDELSIKHLLGCLKGKYLHEITSFDIEKYKQHRIEQGKSVATVNRELACLKHMFTKAIEWKMIDENPARNVKLFKENNRRVRYLSEEEIRNLIDASPAFLKPLIIVALNTGLRRGELFNLQWKDINFHEKIIYIGRSKSGEKKRNTYE